MHISLIGINHQTAPLAVREGASISPAQLEDALSGLRSFVPHAVILSTCNRTEIYATGSDGQATSGAVLDFLVARAGSSPTGLLRYIYRSYDLQAMEHLFDVACGLDSMIIGEYEVLGQVGNALAAAREADMVDPLLLRIFQDAVRTGRKVRDETGVSQSSLSVSSVAVDLATRNTGSLDDSKMLVLGAGEAGRLVAKAARARGVSQILVASRTQARASALAETINATPVTLARLSEKMADCSIVVTCADAPHWVLDTDRMREVMTRRNGRPIVIIDIAVPRNVEPAVKKIDNVFLYNIDDLTGIAESNRKQREAEVQKAKEIISAEVARTAAWWHSLEVRPVVKALMQKAEDIRQTQLGRTLKKMETLSEEERCYLDAMTKSIIVKILNEPLNHLKNSGNGHYIEAVKELFKLDAQDCL